MFSDKGVEIILKDRTGFVLGRISYQELVFRGAGLTRP